MSDMPTMAGDHGFEDQMVVRFFKSAQYMEFKTHKDPIGNPNKAPIFETVQMVEISIPGDKNSVLVERVQDRHMRRFKNTYQNFLDGKGTPGLPLQQWDACDPAAVALFATFKIFTVEQLASVSDGNIENMGPTGHKLREQAKVFVSGKDLANQNSQLRAEMAMIRDNADAKNVALEKQLALLTRLLEKQTGLSVEGPEETQEPIKASETQPIAIESPSQGPGNHELGMAPMPLGELPPHMQEEGGA